MSVSQKRPELFTFTQARRSRAHSFHQNRAPYTPRMRPYYRSSQSSIWSCLYPTSRRFGLYNGVIDRKVYNIRNIDKKLYSDFVLRTRRKEMRGENNWLYRGVLIFRQSGDTPLRPWHEQSLPGSLPRVRSTYSKLKAPLLGFLESI